MLMLMPTENCAKTLAGNRIRIPVRRDLHTVRIPKVFTLIRRSRILCVFE